MPRINVGRPLIDLIKLCFHGNCPILLSGRHGIGKSEIIEQAAAELGIELIARDLSLMEPPDLIGMPKLDGDVTRFLPPAFLPTRGNGLLVLEELNRCPAYMRAPCLQLMTARSLNDYRLPCGWLPIAAVNPSTGDYDVTDLDPALLSRFVCANVEADPVEWLGWARTHGIHEDVMSYVSTDAEIFLSPQSSPRSWKYVSDILYAQRVAQCPIDTLFTAIAGLVGDGRTTAFIASTMNDSRPLCAHEVLNVYAYHRKRLLRWIDDGRLDLVKGTVMSVLKHLQVARSYEDTKHDRKAMKNVRQFIADLPGDLKDQVNQFAAERGYRF
jgi:hypothetical protein